MVLAWACVVLPLSSSAMSMFEASLSNCWAKAAFKEQSSDIGRVALNASQHMLIVEDSGPGLDQDVFARCQLPLSAWGLELEAGQSAPEIDSIEVRWSMYSGLPSGSACGGREECWSNAQVRIFFEREGSLTQSAYFGESLQTWNYNNLFCPFGEIGGRSPCKTNGFRLRLQSSEFSPGPSTMLGGGGEVCDTNVCEYFTDMKPAWSFVWADYVARYKSASGNWTVSRILSSGGDIQTFQTHKPLNLTGTVNVTIAAYGGGWWTVASARFKNLVVAFNKQNIPPEVATWSPTTSPAATRAARTEVLAKSQTGSLNALLLIGASLAGLTFLVIFTSKCIFKDPAAKYLTVLQCSLGIFDMSSDACFHYSISNQPELKIFLWLGVFWLAITALLNAATSLSLLRFEKQGSKEFAAFLANHPLPLMLCIAISPAKASALLLLESRLFQSRTQAWSASLSSVLRANLDKASLILIMEDVVLALPSTAEFLLFCMHSLIVFLCQHFSAPLSRLTKVQVAVVLALQKQYLGGWTLMNILKVAINLFGLICSMAYGLWRLRLANKEWPATNYVQMTEQ